MKRREIFTPQDWYIAFLVFALAVAAVLLSSCGTPMPAPVTATVNSPVQVETETGRIVNLPVGEIVTVLVCHESTAKVYITGLLWAESAFIYRANLDGIESACATLKGE
jgi:hypothetical protein